MYMLIHNPNKKNTDPETWGDHRGFPKACSAPRPDGAGAGGGGAVCVTNLAQEPSFSSSERPGALLLSTVKGPTGLLHVDLSSGIIRNSQAGQCLENS